MREIPGGRLICVISSSVRNIYTHIHTPTLTYKDKFFYHYGAEIPIEEIRFPMAIPNGHLEWFYYHIW